MYDLPADLRNADLAALAEALKARHARKLDIVVPAQKLAFDDGANLVIEGMDPTIEEDGVTDPNGIYRPNHNFDAGIASRLDIPAGYVHRMRAANPKLLADNANSWLRHEIHAGRKYLVRLFTRDEGPGVGRAMLSDVYKPIEDIDVLSAALSGVKASGVEVSVDSCDLTSDLMRVRVVCPAVKALAPVLLDGYRPAFDINSPRAGGWTLEQARRAAANEGASHTPGQEPIVFAGFDIRNSETGRSRFEIVPVLTIEACRNGLRLEQNALSAQHLGARLNEGVFKWSDTVLRKNLELVTAQASEAVRQFCNVGFVKEMVAELEQIAGAEIDKPEEAIKVVRQKLALPQGLMDEVLTHFIKGGQTTAAGIANAMTSVAQFTEDPDAADRLEAKALPAMRLVASL